jgi:hypothetical protein
MVWPVAKTLAHLDRVRIRFGHRGDGGGDHGVGQVREQLEPARRRAPSVAVSA